MTAPREPALAVLELSSIARGVVVIDALVKRAPVELLEARPVSPGKYLIVFGGGVADVEEALAAGLERAGAALVDRLFLPQAHAQLLGALAGRPGAPGVTGALAVVETFSAAAAMLGADAACKAAAVALLELRLAVGLGGKGFFTMTGELADVEAAVAAAEGAIEPAMHLGSELVAAPHEELARRLRR